MIESAEGNFKNSKQKEIHAVIAVWRRGNQAFYARRSRMMQNFPEVWSLLSIQFPQGETTSGATEARVSELFNKMSRERLGNVPITVNSFLTAGSAYNADLEAQINLLLYDIQMEEEPILNPNFYTDGRWMTFSEYLDIVGKQKCGLCSHLWLDYAYLKGWSPAPFHQNSNQI